MAGQLCTSWRRSLRDLWGSFHLTSLFPFSRVLLQPSRTPTQAEALGEPLYKPQKLRDSFG